MTRKTAKKAAKKAPNKSSVITITSPKMVTATWLIRGTSPLVQHRISARVLGLLRRIQEEGSPARNRKDRKPKDFDSLWLEAAHIADKGWYGLPASGLRSALIRACSLVGFTMTMAKMSIFVEADGYGREDRTPLVRITKGEPYKFITTARNKTGVIDLRARPMWDPGWEAKVRLRWDADQFAAQDVGNLLQRVGFQVGMCDGRAFSKESTGMGWGHFEVVGTS